MAERRTQIQVPNRRDDEPPAAPEQLQFIRQLVTGMSLRGFRFDYRKLGEQQAASVIDQLIQLRDASGIAPVGKRGGLGCITGLLRGVTNLLLLLLILAGLAGGGYLIWQRLEQQDDPNQQAGADPRDPSEPKPGADPSQGIELFPDVAGDPGDDPTEPDTPAEREPRITEPDAAPDPAPSPTPDPQRAALRGQLDELAALLSQLSQNTRSAYAQPVRQTVSDNMLEWLDGRPALIEAIEQREPGLVDRIREAIRAYAGASIDAASLRDQAKALRERVQALDLGR